MKSSFSRILLAGLAFSLVALPSSAAQSKETSNAETTVCWQGTDRSFTVKECIEGLRTEAVSKATLGMPASVVQAVGNELLWSPTLLQVLLNHGAAEGTFTRTAILDGVVTDLGSHTFSARQEGDSDSISLSVRLQGHDVQELKASYLADGYGLLESQKVGTGTRTIEFAKGAAIFDSADQQGPAKSSFYVGCFIDTPAWDVYRANFCGRLGSTPSTASFKFFLPYTPSAVVWYGPAGCSGLTCTVPISPGQTIYGGGYWVINGTPTGPRGAEARYFFEPGF